MSWVWRIVAAVVVVGGVAFIAAGANGPDDPELRSAPAPTTTSAPATRTPVAPFGQIAFTIDRMPGVTRCALLAETPEQRRQGLMGRTDLAGHDGMIFRFPEPSSGGFWMKNTIMPLSIAYFDGDGRLVSSTDMEPCPQQATTCPTYAASGPYRYALEVQKGGLSALGVGPGATLTLGGSC